MGRPTRGRGGRPSTQRGRPAASQALGSEGSLGRVAGACLGKPQAAAWAEGREDVVQLAA